jgi:hypothetical protein
LARTTASAKLKTYGDAVQAAQATRQVIPRHKGAKPRNFHAITAWRPACDIALVKLKARTKRSPKIVAGEDSDASEADQETSTSADATK